MQLARHLRVVAADDHEAVELVHLRRRRRLLELIGRLDLVAARREHGKAARVAVRVNDRIVAHRDRMGIGVAQGDPIRLTDASGAERIRGDAADLDIHGFTGDNGGRIALRRGRLDGDHSRRRPGTPRRDPRRQSAAAEADQRRVAFRTDTNTHAPRGRMPSATRGRRAWCGRTRDATPTRHARPIEAVETDILSKRAHRSDVVGSLRFYYPVHT